MSAPKPHSQQVQAVVSMFWLWLGDVDWVRTTFEPFNSTDAYCVFVEKDAPWRSNVCDDPENPTQDLECRVIFASGRREVQVRGPFVELEEQIAAQHLAYWRTA